MSMNTNDMYYVTMTDTFMSGWGHAKNMKNKYIVSCDTMEQAEAIEDAANDRDEMKYVCIRLTKPYYGAGYLETWKTFDELGDVWKKYYTEPKEPMQSTG